MCETLTLYDEGLALGPNSLEDVISVYIDLKGYANSRQTPQTNVPETKASHQRVTEPRSQTKDTKPNVNERLHSS